MNAPREEDDTGPGCNWQNHNLSTRNEILETLKGDNMIDLAKPGSLVDVMGCVFNRVHGLTLQVGSSKSAKEGVDRGIKANNYKCVMGNNVVGGASCKIYGFVQCLR